MKTWYRSGLGRRARSYNAVLLPIAILAGGLATRLRPLTEAVPKCLVKIHGEPFLGRQLRLLARSGAERVVLCVGYLGEQVRAYAGDGRAFGLRVEYSFDGPQLRGTGGALRDALPLLGPAFLVVYGDSYLPCDYRAVERAFLASGQPALMTVFRNDSRWDKSNVEFDGRILAYDKRRATPRMRHIDYGLGAFRREAFAGVSGGDPWDLAALYRDLLREGRLAALEVEQRFYEIGSPEGIRELAEFLQS